MSDSDRILFHQWVNSDDAIAAFAAWKTKQLRDLKPVAAEAAPPKSERVVRMLCKLGNCDCEKLGWSCDK